MSVHAHHDHQHAAPAAELTPGRRRILDVLAAAGRPLGAYEMIDRLAAATGKRPAPISIYRALDFLVDNGLVHRLASRNAFLACGHGHAASEPVVFLICDTCGEVKEATSAEIRTSLDGVASEAGFSARSRVIELAGECARCRIA
jgi:Fur family zinc uptake transcriptional regulator